MAENMKNTAKNIPQVLKDAKVPLAIAGVVLAGGIYYTMTRHATVNETHSSVGSAPTISQRTGEAVSQGYKQEIDKADAARRDKALHSDSSFIPTIMPQNEQTSQLPTHLDNSNEEGSNTASNTPPNLPPVQPHITTPPPAQQVAAAPKPVEPKKPEIYVSPSRIAELQRMLGPHMNADTFAPKVVYINTKVSAMQADSRPSEGAWNAGSKPSIQKASQNAGSNSEDIKFEIPAAGTIIPSHFISLVDNRVPGVVLAVVDEGPYKGARILGSFQQSQGNKLMVSFSSLIVTYDDDNGDSKSKILPIRAVAVSPDTLSQGMATYVNQHMLARLATTMATSFMQGIGQAIQMSGATASYTASGGTFISQGEKNLTQQLLQAGGQSAGSVGQVLSQYFGNMPTTIQIAQYTNFGLLFVGSN